MPLRQLILNSLDITERQQLVYLIIAISDGCIIDSCIGAHFNVFGRNLAFVIGKIVDLNVGLCDGQPGGHRVG